MPRRPRHGGRVRRRRPAGGRRGVGGGWHGAQRGSSPCSRPGRRGRDSRGCVVEDGGSAHRRRRRLHLAGLGAVWPWRASGIGAQCPGTVPCRGVMAGWKFQTEPVGALVLVRSVRPEVADDELSRGYDTCVLRGQPSARSFCAFYLRGGRLLAVDAVDRPAEFMLARRALAQPPLLEPALLADESTPLRELLAPPVAAPPGTASGKP